MKNILVLNAGSSSLKFQLFKMLAEEVMAKGIVEKIGEPDSLIKYQYKNARAEWSTFAEARPIPDHKVGLGLIIEMLQQSTESSQDYQIDAVGHRVVHGGEQFSQPEIMDSQSLEALKEISFLAPLHNPMNILGIEVADELFHRVPQVAVFDTAFHQTMPEHAYRYAIPDYLYRKNALRAYGFHGTSHAFVAKEAAAFLNIPYNEFNGITIHLGNGCSMAAIKNGESVDTSMGLTPMSGLMMGTRSGDIDPSLVLFMHNHLNIEVKEIDRILNKESGLKGIAGMQDVRNILKRYDEGDEAALLAMEMYTYKIKKYIGAYLAVLGHTDAIIFTGGVGENSALVRQKVCDNLDQLGLILDTDQNNEALAENRAIHKTESKTSVLIIPTNEELEIARQTFALLRQEIQ